MVTEAFVCPESARAPESSDPAVAPALAASADVLDSMGGQDAQGLPSSASRVASPGSTGRIDSPVLTSEVRGGRADHARPVGPVVLDATDRRLLALLRADGRVSNARLAEALHLSETACWRRMRRLEATGCITGYQANVSRPALGLGVLALVQIGFASHSGDSPERFEEAVLGIPEILSCRNVTGEADYMLEVVARDLPAYGRFVAEVLRRLPGVATVRSSLCLREVKADTPPPVSAD